MDQLRPTMADCYAAERTYLAWVRTSLAIMGFGFLIARFAAAGMQTAASYFGAGMVLLGSAVNIVSTVEYSRQLRCFRQAGLRRPTATLGMVLASLLILAGLLMAAYLLLYVQ